MCVYLCMKREKEEQESKERVKPKKKERDETFPNESYFSLILGLTYHCPLTGMFPNEINGVMEREYHYWPISWPVYLRESQSSFPTNNNRA